MTSITIGDMAGLLSRRPQKIDTDRLKKRDWMTPGATITVKRRGECEKPSVVGDYIIRGVIDDPDREGWCRLWLVRAEAR